MKRILFLISLVANYIWVDPHGFAQKLEERARLTGVDIPKFLIRAEPLTEAHELARVGGLSNVLEYLDSKGTLSKSEKKLKRRVIATLKELNLDPVESTPLSSDGGALKVLYFLTNSLPYTVSGYTKRSHELMKYVSKSRVEIQGVTRVGYPLTIGKWPKGKNRIVNGIRYHYFIPWLFPRSSESYYKKSVSLVSNLAQELGVTIIHTTTNFPNAIIANRVASRLKLPWVYEVRGELESTWLSKFPKDLQQTVMNSEYYQMARAQETKYANAASAVLVLSEVSRSQLVERGVKPEKIFIVPNSVEPQLIEKRYDKSSLRNSYGVPEDFIIVGTVSSIVSYEGLDTLIRAIAVLPTQYRGLIVGDGLERAKLEDLAHSLGVESRVDFVGYQNPETIDDWYMLLDVFVVPRKDTAVCRTVTPIKALTAQALGIPVVASDLPALREVTGGIESYNAPEDPIDLADKILKVQTHSNGQKWAKTRTWNRTAESLINIYLQIIS